MLPTLGSCPEAFEGEFGPRINQACFHGFDFTLLFEESILTVLPLGIACLCVPFRLFVLWNRPCVARKSWLFHLKLILFLLYITFQITLFAIWDTLDVPRTRLTLGVAAFSFAGFIPLLFVSLMEHQRSTRPSTLLNSYLGVSTLLDIARVRTLFRLPSNSVVASLYCTGFFIKLVLLILEITEKRHLLAIQWRESAAEDVSGIYNRSLFLWLNSVFVRGYKTALTIDILGPIDLELSAASNTVSLGESWTKADKRSSYALLRVFFWHYRWMFIAGIPARLVFSALALSQPFLIQTLLDFINRPEGPDSDNIAHGLTAAYALVYIGIAISSAWCEHKTFRLVTAFRGSLVALVFEKTLRISTASIDESAAIAHMSADIQRIALGIQQVHKLYASVFEVGVILWLLYRRLGVAMAASTGYNIIVLGSGMLMAVLAGKAQQPWLEAISKRLALTSSSLRSMIGIKMSGLAKIMAKDLQVAREREIKASLRHRLYEVFVDAISTSSIALGPPIGFGVFLVLSHTHQGQAFTTGFAYSALTLFLLLETPYIILIEGFEQFQSGLVAFKRIQEYLMSEEQEDYRLILNHESSKQMGTTHLFEKVNEKFETSVIDYSKSAIKISNMSASYSVEANCILQGLDIEVPRGKITVVLGDVGCGKSTLLKAVLGEIPVVSGTVTTTFKHAAYCGQTPWISFGSLQQNILGQSLWDADWYTSVIQACSLETDFAQLPDGDLTETGSRGFRLSGGQQMRVALARALYSRESVVLLDDCLTGLDKTTEGEVIEAILGRNGILRNSQTTVLMTSSSVTHISYADHVIVLNEHGQIVKQGNPDSISYDGDYIKRIENRQQHEDVASKTQFQPPQEKLHSLDAVGRKVDPRRSVGDIKVYRYYFSTVGWFNTILFLLAAAGHVIALVIPSYWLVNWTEYNETHPKQKIGYYLGIYVILGGLQSFLLFASGWMYFIRIAPKTGRRFHEFLLKSTVESTTAFATSTEIGSILNRFSQDLELVDNELQQAFLYTALEALTSVAQCVSVFAGSGYFAAAVPGVIVVLYLVQNYYLRTSRQMRLLDIEAKAPVLSGFLEVLGGLSAIRSYGWMNAYKERNLNALNRSQRPYYLLWTIQRWLTLVLGLITAGLAILLVGIVTHSRKSSNKYLATSLVNIVGLSFTLQWFIRRWTQLETSLGAVSRIQTFALTTPAEDKPGEEAEPPQIWPEKGNIRFEQVSATYGKSAELVLKDVNLDIRAGQKVALCGRTGSGKSSLVATMSRMLEIETGTLSIDGVDLTSISRQQIRERLNTLPQEVIFLQGSIRKNLDPWGRMVGEDSVLIEALRAVKLYEHLIGGAGGSLDDELNKVTLSHGQRQLFCLARAIVTKDTSSILILDEPTSSMDMATDEVIQAIIREQFCDKTVVIVTHKVRTVIDFDLVAVLENGCIVELGVPAALLEREGSAFRLLYESD